MSAALILLSDFQKTEIELWRPIEGYPGYEVSSLGRVRSFRRQGPTTVLNTKPVILRLRPRGRMNRKSGCYLGIGLSQGNGKSRYRYFFVQTLVAKAFLGMPPVVEGRLEVNHITGLKTDNRQGNLEYMSGSQNKLHAVQHGLYQVGEGNGNSRLTIEQVREIKHLGREGYSQRRRGRMFNVSGRSIAMIDNGETWNHVT